MRSRVMKCTAVPLIVSATRGTCNIGCMQCMFHCANGCQPVNARAGGMTTPRWLVLTWRLTAASSTPRVATWRNLQRLGAITLTPGAVIGPYSEHLLEPLGWSAGGIVPRRGESDRFAGTALRA